MLFWTAVDKSCGFTLQFILENILIYNEDHLQNFLVVLSTLFYHISPPIKSRVVLMADCKKIKSSDPNKLMQLYKLLLSYKHYVMKMKLTNEFVVLD